MLDLEKMKVVFKIKGKVEIIPNVSVDDKCFPLVGGIHPYSASSKSKSPLALESSLWFKTLAVDAVYIDCDSSLIFWSEVRNEQISEEVKIRRKRKGSFIHYDSEFVPEHARPLVSDTTLFDFDPSYKEMIVKSNEVAKKLIHKSISVNDTNSSVANLLHVYILPSINFTNSDLYALSRARCLIEERLLKADDDIAAKAKAINLLLTSLENLKDNLLLKDNYESESYLLTCNMKFLKAFLKKIEEDSLKRNLELEAQQSKVNWAKEQKYEEEEIAEFQKTRNALFKEVEKLIKVREALKNVVTRKAKIKRKPQAKQQIIDSCFHNVFLEILRRTEVENKTIEQLVEDKLNISAAREAIMSVILELDEKNRISSSDRSTRFEPSTFGDYHPDGKVQVEKSDAWLTLQERVGILFLDKSSPVALIHAAGCKNIKLHINLALSEFHLHDKRLNEGKEKVMQAQDEPERASQTDSYSIMNAETPDIHDQQTEDSGKEKEEDSDHVIKQKPDTSDSMCQDTETNLRHSLRVSSSSSTSRRSGLVFDKGTLSTNLNEIAEEEFLNSKLEIREDEGIADNAKNEAFENLGFIVIDEIELDETPKPSEQKGNKNFFVSENLAINMLMAAVENVKTGIHEHFKEVVQSLQEHLNPQSVDPFEILWKVYERHFSEEVLQSLTTMYHTMLQLGSRDVYREIQRTSMQDLLEGDKILSLFYQPSACNVNKVSPDEETQPIDTISMAKTMSNMSLDVRQYSVNELYNLANADSSDLCRRFQLDTDDHQQEAINGSASSSESGASVKTSDLFDDDIDDDDEDMSHSNISSSNSSKVDSSKAGSLDRNPTSIQEFKETRGCQAESELKSNSSAISSDTPSETLEILSPHEIIDMDPVLSPFRKQIVKCMNARSVLDRMRYLSKGVQRLNNDISLLYGQDHVSACDDIISMLVLSLANMPEDIFVGLYSNLRLLIDILPSFLSGTLCDYNLICLCAAYDYMLNRNVCQRVVKRYGASFKVKLAQS